MCQTVLSKPPLAVFMASLVGFIVTLIFVSVYVRTHEGEILNPDVKDWNSFYSTLSGMDICFPTSSKMSKLQKQVQPETTSISPDINTSIANITSKNETILTYTLSADVHIMQNGTGLKNLSLHSFIGAKFLGSKRDSSEVDITIELSKNQKNWTACIVLSGPAHLLPNSPLAPPKCDISKNSELIDVFMAQPWLVNTSEWCNNGEVGSLTVTPQDELIVYLSQEDVSLIQLHILYTTSLLCVMMIVLMGYFVLGKRCTSKQQSLDKVPLTT